MKGDYNNFNLLAAKFHKAASQLVRKAAFDVEAAAKQHAPVETGFLKSSIYVRTSTTSDYGNGVTGDAQHTLLPEVEAPGNETTALVAVGASYGVYVEMGTRYMAAQPYLTPAVEQVKPAFLQAAAHLEKLF